MYVPCKGMYLQQCQSELMKAFHDTQGTMLMSDLSVYFSDASRKHRSMNGNIPDQRDLFTVLLFDVTPQYTVSAISPTVGLLF